LGGRPVAEGATTAPAQKASTARTFPRWYQREGHVTRDVADHPTCSDGPLRNHRDVYGTAHARNPGRWLTKDAPVLT